jgi:Glycosyltransferase family 87
VNARARQLSDAVLVLVALLVSAHAAITASALGDYPNDGGPALDALLRGDLHAFANANPAMGDVSLLARAPFVALAYLGHHPSELELYRWGVFPCVLSVALLALWFARIARTRGVGLVGQWAIVLVALVNPVVSSAVALGHPEELMTSSLCIAALVAALQRRPLLATVLLGLALACKEWAVVGVLPVLLALDRDRWWAFFGALATAAIVTVPEVVGGPLSYLKNQLYLARGVGVDPSTLSWWWPLAPPRTTHVLVEGRDVAIVRHPLPPRIAYSLHSLIVTGDVLIAAVIGWTRRLPLRRDDAFALMAIVMLLRCSLDTETMAYFHTALLLDLLAWDVLSGERIPLRALACAAVSYVVFDRLNSAGLVSPASFAYGASTIVALALFAWTLIARRPRSKRPARLRLSLSA